MDLFHSKTLKSQCASFNFHFIPQMSLKWLYKTMEPEDNQEPKTWATTWRKDTKIGFDISKK